VPHWSCCGSAEVDVARLAELVTDAWRMRAPAGSQADLDPAVGSRRA